MKMHSTTLALRESWSCWTNGLVYFRNNRTKFVHVIKVLERVIFPFVRWPQPYYARNMNTLSPVVQTHFIFFCSSARWKSMLTWSWWCWTNRFARFCATRTKTVRVSKRVCFPWLCADLSRNLCEMSILLQNDQNLLHPRSSPVSLIRIVSVHWLDEKALNYDQKGLTLQRAKFLYFATL